MIETVPVMQYADTAEVDVTQTTLGDTADPRCIAWRSFAARELKEKHKAKHVYFKRLVDSLLREGENEIEVASIGRDGDAARNVRKGELRTWIGLSTKIERENAATMDLLVAQVRSPMSVVPFVGAGLSVEFGFPAWPKFLIEAASTASSPGEVLAHIEAGHLIDAATVLYRDSPERFQRAVGRAFGNAPADNQLQAGPLALLPMIASGPVITTNFDSVLEAVFRAAGSPFERLVTGQQPDNIIRAMHRNERALIKLHGDALDRSARVFTGLEYDQSYGAIDGQAGRSEGGIPKLARIMFTNRPLLFVGCSLDYDRTLEVLRDLHADLPGVNHYAIVSATLGVDDLAVRRSELESYGIVPIWFAPGDFSSIGRLLEHLLQEASTRLLWPRHAAGGNPWPHPVSSAVTAASTSSTDGFSTASTLNEHRVATRIARRIVNGRVGFFLGAGANLDTVVSAEGFYSDWARAYGFDHSSQNSHRAEVAQFAIDRETKTEAWAAAKQQIQKSRPTSSEVIQFLAELPSLLSNGRSDRPKLWFLSTNYDAILEEELARRGEPFHLLYYQVDGTWEGRFVHRSLDGSLRLIEKPQNIRTLETSGHVVVKLDGGIAWDPRIPETVALSPIDFSISAGRLPRALPEFLRRVLLNQGLLVLGSSLYDVHVQRLVRWSAGDGRAVKTWAVKTDVTPAALQFWAAAGVELIGQDLRDFVPALRDAILAQAR